MRLKQIALVTKYNINPSLYLEVHLKMIQAEIINEERSIHAVTTHLVYFYFFGTLVVLLH